MQKIILLVGDSGSGKDFILSIANRYEGIEVVKRALSRAPRGSESDSISAIFSVDIEEIKKMDYFYEGAESGRWYGIWKKDLDAVLARGKSPMVICPNYDNLVQMTRDYSAEMIEVYFIYRGYDDEELDSWRQSLVDRGSSQEEINKREKNRDKYFRELYINHFYDYSSNVILNPYGISTEEDIMMQLEGLARKNDIDMGEVSISSNRK